MKEKKDYNSYRFTIKDWLCFLLAATGKMVLICYLFFDSCKAFLLVLPFIVMDYQKQKKEKIEQQKHRLMKQFQSFMESVASSLNAGYSLESSIVDARHDLGLIYQPNTDIFFEMELMIEGMKVNVPIEERIKDLGARSGIQDIRNFANVVMVAKRNGGNLIHIIDKTVKCISDKMSVEEEIKTLIAAKKLEQKIMMIMPFGILFYLRVTSGEFLQVLYHNAIGVALMTIFLLLIYLADFWAKKIMEIPV